MPRSPVAPLQGKETEREGRNVANKKRGGVGRQIAHQENAERPHDGGQNAQESCGTQLPPSRVRKLNSHDVSVENKKRKYTRKRNLDQQQDGGQKRICFRNERQQVAGAEPPPRAPTQQPQVTAPLSNTGQDDTDGPGSPAAVLR